MRAAVLTGIGHVEVQDRPDPVARPGWVVVRVDVASLCGTDAHQYEGRIDSPFPRVPGHDFAGTVDSVGDGVDPGLAGRQFAVKPSLPCGQCAACAAGAPLDCPRKTLIGLWSDGCLAERIAVPAVNLVPVPEGVPLHGAALLEPFAAVGLNCVDRLDLRLGDSVLVLGQGRSGWRSPGWRPPRAPGSCWSPTSATRSSPCRWPTAPRPRWTAGPATWCSRCWTAPAGAGSTSGRWS
ncbi:Alcohol dehydrogenase GroES-like domain-containing protein [Geodermatophilus pulveris]|uniref:Alcohol dehydrogenase GroES-like domain-containing protein n=1 Tax=Geodermatophilus pulveris TaxID=1564159 RepID=A0A239HFV1_9ACTN|nr:alcohol dehydrogenase catalytic domain-containing protein [Geodermatophilus pulveris]SNS80237.1 Alcohol dehydrogenase GroES-like domain-containing protein [Geodermatophilus pulveris]